MRRHLWSLACLSALLAVGCGSDPSKPEVHNPKVPTGSTIAIVGFRDCVIKDQDDCSGSGGIATNVFTGEFGNSAVFHVAVLSRPVGAEAELSDEAAVAYAKEKGYAYVMNGEVTDFYRVAPMTFRKERAAVAVRVLSVADGRILYVHTDEDTANNMSSPEEILKDMAGDVKDDLEDN